MVLDVPDTPGLSWTERCVQGLLAQGMTACAISKCMGVSASYVHRLRRQIRANYSPNSEPGFTHSEPEFTVNQSSPIVNRGSQKPHGTVPAIARASDSSLISSPTPDSSLPNDSQSTPKKIQRARKKTFSPAAARRDPWEWAILKVFDSVHPISAWGQAWKSFDRLKARARVLSPDDPGTVLAAMVDLFARITRGDVACDRWLRERPFTPRALDNQFDSVLAIAKSRAESKADTQEVFW